MWNSRTYLWLDLWTVEFVLQDNNWVNGMWYREWSDRYFFIGHYSDEEEAYLKSGDERRFKTVWSTL